MGVEGAARCIKFLVFIFNFLFFVCGIGLMGVGIFVQLKIGDFAELSTVKYVTGSILIIIVGAFIALVAFFGCCGAVKENTCFLGIFFGILLLILCAEIAGTVLGYIYRGKVEKNLRTDLNNSIALYGEKGQDGITKAFDSLQQKEKCCGVNNYTDWQRSPFSNGSHDKVPDSCCHDKKPGCGEKWKTNPPESEIYKEGCYGKVETLVKDNLMLIFGLGIGVAVIQIIAMIFAIILICKIREQGSFA
ncbi:CD63 antigen-like [Actinia tenebrosa]|uniref:Tetraspanin n=1 Tax=Actinia tenebrosa TaxID=6105 RepID=A0A6P8J1T2_ACTTE|nr:CD63 antigen-like [Actinia tenebrosa]